MNRSPDEATLAESNVSLKLADIQKRCSQLIDAPDALDGLTLEDPVSTTDNTNPYDRG